MKMADELPSVMADGNSAVKELGGEEDCLVDQVLLLQNNTMELADELARVARSPGWGA